MSAPMMTFALASSSFASSDGLRKGSVASVQSISAQCILVCEDEESMASQLHGNFERKQELTARQSHVIPTSIQNIWVDVGEPKRSVVRIIRESSESLTLECSDDDSKEARARSELKYAFALYQLWGTVDTCAIS